MSVGPDRGKPFSKLQKQFDRQLRKLEHLRSDYEQLAARWEWFLRTYEREIRPAEMELNRHRISFLEALADAWEGPSRLGKRQRESLVGILERELVFASEIEPNLLEKHSRLRDLARRMDPLGGDSML